MQLRACIAAVGQPVRESREVVLPAGNAVRQELPSRNRSLFPPALRLVSLV
jgi:hypothetical protein